MNKQMKKKPLEIKLIEESWIEFDNISLSSSQEQSINKQIENIHSKKEDDQLVVFEEPNTKREPSSPNIIPSNFWKINPKENVYPEKEELDIIPDDNNNSISLKMSDDCLPMNIIHNFHCNKFQYNFECSKDSSDTYNCINHPQIKLEIEKLSQKKDSINFLHIHPLNLDDSVKQENNNELHLKEENIHTQSKEFKYFLKDHGKRNGSIEFNKFEISEIKEQESEVAHKSPPLTARIINDSDTVTYDQITISKKSAIQNKLSTGINQTERENEIPKFYYTSSFHTKLNNDRKLNTSNNFIKEIDRRKNSCKGLQNKNSGRNKEHTIYSKKIIEVNLSKNSPKVIKKEYKIRKDLVAKFEENFNRSLGKLEFNASSLSFSQTKQLFQELSLLEDNNKSAKLFEDMWKLISIKNMCPIQNIRNFLSVVINLKQEIISKEKTIYTFFSNGTKYGRIISSGEFIANKEESQRLKEHYKLFQKNHIKSRRKNNSISIQRETNPNNFLFTRNFVLNHKFNPDSSTLNQKQHHSKNNSTFQIRKQSMQVKENDLRKERNKNLFPSSNVHVNEKETLNFSSKKSPIRVCDKNDLNLPKLNSSLNTKHGKEFQLKNPLNNSSIPDEEFIDNKPNVKNSNSKHLYSNRNEEHVQNRLNSLEIKDDQKFFTKQSLDNEAVSNNHKELTNAIVLYIDVNIGNETFDRIYIKEDDSPNSVASNFIAKHNLDMEEKAKLVSLIQSQITNFLDSIKEESRE